MANTSSAERKLELLKEKLFLEKCIGIKLKPTSKKSDH